MLQLTSVKYKVPHNLGLRFFFKNRASSVFLQYCSVIVKKKLLKSLEQFSSSGITVRQASLHKYIGPSLRGSNNYCCTKMLLYKQFLYKLEVTNICNIHDFYIFWHFRSILLLSFRRNLIKYVVSLIKLTWHRIIILTCIG